MKVARGFRSLGLELDAPAVTIGNFDGVHRGHQQVMRAAVREAARRSVPAVACTFEPHTLRVLRPDAAPEALQTVEQRLAAIEEVGIDVAVVVPFDTEVAATSAEEFVQEFLIGELHVGSLHLSKGFSFGRHKSGDRAYLERRGENCGFRVERVPALVVDGAPVSSTRIRSLLARGAVVEAAGLLGRPFAVIGRVVRGAGRGRALAARTANLEVDNGCLPTCGVYLTETRLDAAIWPSITNVGTRPTFGGDGERVVETHLLDYAADSLYGRPIEVAFLERVRDELRFDTPTELRAQIAADIEHARRFFAARRAPDEGR